jgi:aspartyl-tRNA(Asn)/glutamyl-tRNA(Gln) amidotransferase subunit A
LNRREWLSAAVGGMVLSCSRFAKAEKIVGGELAWLTLKQASDQIRARQISRVELTEACLARMDTCNPKITTWITVMRDQALKQAKMLEQEQAAGKLRSPLHGVPIGLKDTIDTKGVRTTRRESARALRSRRESNRRSAHPVKMRDSDSLTLESPPSKMTSSPQGCAK